MKHTIYTLRYDSRYGTEVYVRGCETAANRTLEELAKEEWYDRHSEIDGDWPGIEKAIERFCEGEGPYFAIESHVVDLETPEPNPYNVPENAAKTVECDAFGHWKRTYWYDNKGELITMHDDLQMADCVDELNHEEIE